MSDDIRSYTFVYDEENSRGAIKDSSDVEVTDSSFEPVLSALNRKPGSFDGCNVIKDGEWFFMDTLPDLNDTRFLCYFNGMKIKYISSREVDYDIQKVKVLDDFVR